MMNAATAQAPQPAPPPAGPLGHRQAELLDLLAYIFLENDRPEKAAVLLAALQALGLADARRRVALALAQLRSGKPEAALETLERALLQGGGPGAGDTGAALHLVRAQALSALNRRPEAQAAMRAYVAMRGA